MSGEEFHFLRYHGTVSVKDFIGGAGGGRPSERLCVPGLEGGSIIVREDDAAHCAWAKTGNCLD